MYDSKVDLSLPNFGSGKNVISTRFGLLLVLARRSVIIAGLSTSFVNVACFTVEPSGVKTRVDADLEGRVQRLDRSTASSADSHNVLPPYGVLKDLLRQTLSAGNVAEQLGGSSMADWR